MQITYPSNGKGLIEKWDLNDPSQKILFDKREKYKNLVYDDVLLGRAKKENVRNVLIIQRDGYQKALNELWAGGNSLIGDKDVFNSMFFERQIEFFNGLIERLDGIEASLPIEVDQGGGDEKMDILKEKQNESAKQGASDIMPEIIKKLHGMGKVDHTPMDGKYKPTMPIKDFIYWTLDSKDDKDEIKELKKELDENFFIKWFYYDVKDDTLKKYFRAERRWLDAPKPQKQKPRKRTKTDKSGTNPV
ncbi:hypothetical protein FACS189442_4530 [Spirochaetia bacterium]|nr:hypothetical protein FACS189442_4530 [Spirochaetia bacterium]